MAENISKPEVKFNQAGYQQERINDLMRVVNFCWINPTQFNNSFGDYNYRVIYRVLTSYYTEIRVKLKTERKDIDEVLKNLDSYIEEHPIVKVKKNSPMYGSGGGSVLFDSESWKIIKRCLLIYQNKILDAAESHGMGNPTKKNPIQAATDM